MSEPRKLKIQSVGNPSFPHLIHVIDVDTDEYLDNIFQLDVSFRAGSSTAPGIMYRYKTLENGKLELDDRGETSLDQEAVDVVSLLHGAKTG